MKEVGAAAVWKNIVTFVTFSAYSARFSRSAAELEDQMNPERKRGYYRMYNGAGRKVFGNWSLVTLFISVDSQTVVAKHRLF